MNAFQPRGALLSFTGATSAPTSVQATTQDNVDNFQVMLTNIDPTIDCGVGWGASDAAAKANAVASAGSPNCYYLLRGTQVAITVAPGSYFSGITPASTAVIKVQAGTGE